METITFIIDWLKEYGDVLGGIGSIFAVITIVATNGRVILARFRGDPVVANVSGSNDLTTGSTGSKGIGLFAGGWSVRRPPPKNSMALMPLDAVGDVNPAFARGLLEALAVDLVDAGFSLIEMVRSVRHETGGTGKLVPEERDTSLLSGQDLMPHSKFSLKILLRRDGEEARANIQAVNDKGIVVHSERLRLNFDGGLVEEERISLEITSGLRQTLLASRKHQKDQNVALDARQGIQRRSPDLDEKDSIRFSPKSRSVTALLVMTPLGILGVHRFYIGRPFTGILYLLTGGFFVAGWIMDIVLTLSGVLADGKGRPIVFWRRAKARAGLEPT